MMGQHKYNPTAIKAKNGELPPKPKKMGKRESDRLLHAECQRLLYGRLVAAYARGMMADMRKGEGDA